MTVPVSTPVSAGSVAASGVAAALVWGTCSTMISTLSTGALRVSTGYRFVLVQVSLPPSVMVARTA